MATAYLTAGSNKTLATADNQPTTDNDGDANNRKQIAGRIKFYHALS
jgi:hypothetical protein